MKRSTTYLPFILKDYTSNSQPTPTPINTPTPVSTNSPPNTPSNSSPAHNAIGVTVSTNLAWTGGDPNTGDTVTYDVYLSAGNNNPTTIICNNTSTTTCDPPGNLLYNMDYYWKVVARDNRNATSTSSIWHFKTTVETPNDPPYAPSNPSPVHNTLNASVTTNLTWTGGDPNYDVVTYDVYLSANNSNPTTLICDNTPVTSCDPSGDLLYDTDYYWKVVATDSRNATSTSSIWYFRTDNYPCNTPGTPSLTSPQDGTTINDNTPTFNWDSANDLNEYHFQLDNNANFSSPEIDTIRIDMDYTPILELSDGIYYWRVRGHNTSNECNVYGSWSSVWSVNIANGEVSVVSVWTADGNWSPKTTFAPGDPIKWVIDIQNTTNENVLVELTFDARGPNGEQVVYWSGVVTASVGSESWGLPGTIPFRMNGTHTFSGYGLYQDVSTQATMTYSVIGLSIGMIETGGYEYPRDRLAELGYSVSLLPVNADIDTFRQYGIVYLPLSWADGFSGSYLEIEAQATDYRTYVNEGGGLFIDQPNPFDQPDDSVSPTLLPYSMTFYNLYNTDDWPPIIINPDHYITIGLLGEDMPGPADQITALDSTYEVLVRGQLTNSPSLVVTEYGQGRIVVQTDFSGGGFSDEVYHRMIEWVSTDVVSTDSLRTSGGSTLVPVKKTTP